MMWIALAALLAVASAETCSISECIGGCSGSCSSSVMTIGQCQAGSILALSGNTLTVTSCTDTTNCLTGCTTMATLAADGTCHASSAGGLTVGLTATCGATTTTTGGSTTTGGGSTTGSSSLPSQWINFELLSPSCANGNLVVGMSMPTGGCLAGTELTCSSGGGLAVEVFGGSTTCAGTPTLTQTLPTDSTGCITGSPTKVTCGALPDLSNLFYVAVYGPGCTGTPSVVAYMPEGCQPFFTGAPITGAAPTMYQYLNRAGNTLTVKEGCTDSMCNTCAFTQQVTLGDCVSGMGGFGKRQTSAGGTKYTLGAPAGTTSDATGILATQLVVALGAAVAALLA